MKNMRLTQIIDIFKKKNSISVFGGDGSILSIFQAKSDRFIETDGKIKVEYTDSFDEFAQYTVSSVEELESLLKEMFDDDSEFDSYP